jgi:hypothetical protein
MRDDVHGFALRLSARDFEASHPQLLGDCLAEDLALTGEETAPLAEWAAPMTEVRQLGIRPPEQGARKTQGIGVLKAQYRDLSQFGLSDSCYSILPSSTHGLMGLPDAKVRGTGTHQVGHSQADGRTPGAP